MRELDQTANQQRAKIEDAKYRRNLVYEGGKVDGNNTFYDLMSSNIEEVKKVRAEKNEKFQRMNELKERQITLDKEKQNILKSVPRNYQTEADLTSAIKEK